MIKCANISQKVGCEAWCDGVPLALRAKGSSHESLEMLDQPDSISR